MSKLILFTASFPYGKKETYLETEISYLSKFFDRVEIFPHYYNNKDVSKRIVPENVIVHKPALPLNKFKRLSKSVLGILKGKCKRDFIEDFFKYKLYKNRKQFTQWFLTFIDYSATINSKAFKQVKIEENTRFYFYWGSGWAYSLLNLNKDNGNTYFMRLHGGEAYLDRSNGYIPIRNTVFSKVDFFLTISNHLSDYIKLHYNINSEKVILSRLGVKGLSSYENSKSINVNNIIRLVSCSNLIPLKRIDLIIDALQLLDGYPVEWIHYGDGPELKQLLTKIEFKMFKTISIDFRGRVNNTEIISHYKSHHVDAFINVSKYEGLPVSLMEAMAYGIPCIATNAGATSEIVNNVNGVLLSNDFDVKDLAHAFKQIKSEEWYAKRKKAFSHWNLLFNAGDNYNKLGRFLILKHPINKTYND